MTENYRPQSPDFSSLSQPTTSPFFNAYPHSRISQQYVPPYQHFEDMARRSSRIAQSDSQPIYDDPMPEAIQPIHEPIYAPVHEPLPVQHIPEPIAHIADAPKMEISTAGIEVKTKFPVARIKRIMQADEDVGKVAQVTPIAVCMYLPNSALLVANLGSRAKTKKKKKDTHTDNVYSQGPGTFHDLSRHKGSTRSQGSQLKTRHRFTPETGSRQG
jgi:hypothetical protein